MIDPKDQIANSKAKEKAFYEVTEQIKSIFLNMVLLIDKVLNEQERYYLTSSIESGEWALPYEDIIYIIIVEGIKITQTDYEQIKTAGKLLNFEPPIWEKLLENSII